MQSCGILSDEECDAIYEVLFDGAVLPAGRYVLDISLSAFDPLSSTCEIGCGSAGGRVSLVVVPEPTSAVLLGLALAGLVAIWRGR